MNHATSRKRSWEGQALIDLSLALASAPWRRSFCLKDNCRSARNPQVQYTHSKPQVLLPRRSARRGQSTIEFLFVAFLLLLVIFAGIEFDRLLFVYTNLADAAKAGARYAIVHGGDNRTGSGASGPSGPTNITVAGSASPPSQVVATVQNYVTGIDPSRLTIFVTYPDGTNSVGSRVTVAVQYNFDPFTILPLGTTLSATSQGVITF